MSQVVHREDEEIKLNHLELTRMQEEQRDSGRT